MSAVVTYTKSGAKSTTAAKLDKSIFGLTETNHELLKQAYLNYLGEGRANIAVAKRRGEVRGGGQKPWRQKGTGRARFGSSRNPIWRGGGAAFGPTGNETYSRKLNQKAKHVALRQALSLAEQAGKIKVIESLDVTSGKVKPIADLLKKIEAGGRSLIVVDELDDMTKRSTRNIASVKAVQAKNLTVFDVLNADHIVIGQKALVIISDWLGDTTKTKRVEAAV